MEKPIRVGSLFSGIGGFDLGLERAGFEIAWQVEIDAYCRRVLARHWPHVMRYGDTREVDWDDRGYEEIERVDLVCGGWPCQPFSLAGKRRGREDDRHLWPEVVRCLRSIRPAWFLGENVPGILSMEIDTVLADLEGLGYEVAPPFVIPACAVDAPHQRKRVWVVAYSANYRLGRGEPFKEGRSSQRDVADTADERRHPRWTQRQGQERQASSQLPRCDVAHAQERTERFRLRQDKPTEQRGRRSGDSGSKEDLSNTNQQYDNTSRFEPDQICRFRSKATILQRSTWWPPESGIRRVAHGVPHRVDRLKGLGNAVVPQIVEWFGRQILDLYEGEG